MKISRRAICFTVMSKVRWKATPRRSAIRVASLALLAVASSSAAQQTLTQTLKMETAGVTVRYPASWSVARTRLTGLTELINVPAAQQHAVAATARVKIRVESRKDHAAALRRLREIWAGHEGVPSELLEIGGWPALQFRRLQSRPQPSQGPQFADRLMLKSTTAVAAGNLLVRLESALPSDASQALMGQVEFIGRSLVFTTSAAPGQVQEELEKLRRRPADSSAEDRRSGPPAGSETQPRSAETQAPSGQGAPGQPEPGLNVRVTGFGGLLPDSELEVAASPDAQNIVIGSNHQYHFSTDGGQTWQATTTMLLGRDPSVAYGRSAAFYAANINGSCQPADAAGPFGYDCTGIWRSTDNGQTFPFVANAVVCPRPDLDPSDGVTPVAGSCFPDQEHIVADRFAAAPGGGDQIYSTWRNFDATDADPAIVCSQDNGANWTVPVDVGSGEFPRIGIGQDALVYVAYFDGGNYMLRAYSSCATGLVPQGPPVTVAPRIPVVCPFPGHDRCDQNPSSQTVAVDDTNPNHIYYAFAENTAAGNEDIVVQDSLDGGLNWGVCRANCASPAGTDSLTPCVSGSCGGGETCCLRRARVNAAVPAQRIMPWLCTTAGEAFVTWYDRRAATPCPVPPCPGSNNDLTDFYAGRAGLDATGTLTAGNEFKLSEVADPWCASGWLCGTRQAPGASESCSQQPQRAGFCADTTGAFTGARCDFSDCGGVGMGVGASCQCNIATNETCNDTPLGGCPKYGDYNGSACAAGQLLATWASATSPPGIAPSSDTIDIFFAAIDVDDVDGDGVRNDTEDAAPNGGDGNDDGIDDRDQTHVTSLPAATAGQDYLTLVTNTGCKQNENVMAVPEAALGDDPEFEYPFGLIKFELPCETATVTVIYHGTVGPLNRHLYRKFGRTPPFVDSAHFYTLPTVLFGTTVVGGQTRATAMFTLTDAQLGDGTGDDDRIFDPGGPALIAANPAPVLRGKGLVLLVILLGAVGLYGLARPRFQF